ncbi:MAG TPA: tetratricopeptide repeat protein [Bryobacteraceae bacterium]|nr:tetratricopeptide repeat protein [Bryobacteraceae bacterium]
MIFSDLYAEIYEIGAAGSLIDRSSVSGNGEFTLSGVPAGPCNLRITDGSGAVLSEQLVEVGASFGRVQVRLAGGKVQRPISGFISLAELQHKVPSKAATEARKYDKAILKKNLPEAIVHLEKALEIDPEYLFARRNLALCYLRTGEDDKAIAEFQKILKADPRSVTTYAGMSSAYVALQRYPDAENAARRTLDIDGSNELGHYFLGVSLMAQQKGADEAIAHLMKSVKRFPRAHLALAGLFLRKGHKDEAKTELQQYLDSGDSGARAQAQQLLAEIGETGTGAAPAASFDTK